MVLSELRQIDSIPLNESGKIDRKALKAGLSAAHSGPRPEPGTDSESKLRLIWEELLQVTPIALTGDFSDLGGDSLLAALLVVQIQTHFGLNITPETLVECPDIKSLAARLGKQGNHDRSAIMPLRAAGSKLPLFIVHGLGGSALLFRSLCAHLEDGQPVYGVTLPSGVVPKEKLAIDVLASEFLEQIKSISPSRPYCLAGHSFGALIAFEMASQLLRSGEQVGLLALLDGDRNLATRVNGAFEDVGNATLALRRYQAKLRSLNEKGIAEVVRRRFEHIKLHKRIKLAEQAAADEALAVNFEAKELMAFNARAYAPAVYPGRAILFRARDEVRSEAQRDLGWAHLIWRRPRNC